MDCTFKSGYYIEGNRIFIKIPFNVWDIFGKKGNIPVRAVIDDIVFECKLIPKGSGEYVLPVNKEIFRKLNKDAVFNVELTFLEQLSRINNNSPYSKANPIRHIDRISFMKQPATGLCGQTCLAMLAGISVDEVIKIMKSKRWQASASKVLETLDYFGFSYNKPVYTHGKKVSLPKCCIVNVKSDGSHLIVFFDGLFYDPATDVTSDWDFEKVISYIEIDH